MSKDIWTSGHYKRRGAASSRRSSPAKNAKKSVCLMSSIFVFIRSEPWEPRTFINLCMGTCFFPALRYFVVFGVLFLVAEHCDKEEYQSNDNYDFNPDHGEWDLRVVGKGEDPSVDSIVVVVVVSIAYRGEIVGEGVEIEVAHRGELIDDFLCAEE